MKILREKSHAGPRVLALGMFDGMHRGHQELIRRAARAAREAGVPLRVCTFDRHPLEVLRPEQAPQRLQTAREQAESIERLGAEELRVFPFTRETAALSPEAFLDLLAEECDIRAIAAGWNYTFGCRGAGSAETLRHAGAARGFEALIVPPVRDEDGETVSSTAIREKLLSGDLEGANRMLGVPYEISGTVVNGKHEGSRIGFPTANIRTEEHKLLPAFGVYACRMACGEESWQAVVNIGTQPTLPSGQVTVEAHALGAHENLYGRQARVNLLKYLRPEKRFDSVEALIAQIAKDKEETKRFFQSGNASS